MKKIFFTSLVIFLGLLNYITYSQTLPVNWTGDIDIDTYQESTIIHGGLFSCRIDVNSGTQANCDLSNDVIINVTAGNTYTYSFWAYTSAHVRITGVLDWIGAAVVYNNVYVGPNTGGWAQWTFSGTVPSGATGVNLRIRCYDVTGYTSPEIQYIDDFSFESPTGTSLPVSNGNLENWPSVPEIVSAYAISNTAIDVLYNLDVTAVDPSDYNMSGSASTVFSSATIDGANAQLVHLTGANPAMAADITLDNLSDDANSSNIDLYAGIMPFTFTNSNNPGGVMDNVHLATFKGIVSANDAFNAVWVSDAAGQYHGALIFSTPFQALVSVGNQILFTATRTVYNGQTELQNPSLISIISSGNTPYGPSVITGSDINETLAVNTNPAETWESQLTKIQNFTVLSYDNVNYDYRCSWFDGEETFYFHIGDNVDNHFTLTGPFLIVGQNYLSITGVIDWDNGTLPGPFYRINPRTSSDVVANIVNPATKLAIISVNGGVDPYENVSFSITVQSQDALGNPAVVTSNLNFNLSTNGGSGGTVAFAIGSTTSGTIISGTNEIILTGVKMAPAGTNVTITATDVSAGLIPGTSVPFNVLAFTLPDIIICEIMPDPLTVLDNVGEWFEIFNNEDASVDLNGWIVKDDGTNSFTITGTFNVPAHSFAVLGNNADNLTNGGYICNYAYPVAFQLSNSDDEIVLLLPDGVTEIDRVNYTGVAPWVDPTGASMIFAGLATDNNNDGTKWIVSSLREPSFTGATGDLGSPGTLGTGQFTGITGFSLDLKVFLEGPYDATTDIMKTDLLSNNLIPLNQPFNPTLPYYGNNTPKWIYNGTQSVTSFPAGTVDYVLIELRDAPSAALATSATRIAQVPALLKSDGSIVSLNGTSLPAFTTAINDFLYIIVWSRNHVGIMSSGDITPGGTVVWDFTTGAGQFYGTSAGYKEIETGVWGMASGDINADGSVSIADKTPSGWKVDAGKNGYLGADLNMNGQVNNKDKNDYWLPNNTIKSTQVPN
jgi:hypothetical protein